MKRILLADDDSSVLQLLTRALSDYELAVARDGGEAWMAASHPSRSRFKRFGTRLPP